MCDPKNLRAFFVVHLNQDLFRSTCPSSHTNRVSALERLAENRPRSVGKMACIVCGKDGLHCFLKSVLIFNVDFIAQVGGKKGDGGWTKLVDACMGTGRVTEAFGQRVTEVFGQRAADRPGAGACPWLLCGRNCGEVISKGSVLCVAVSRPGVGARP